jgi:hypothetical protein
MSIQEFLLSYVVDDPIVEVHAAAQAMNTRGSDTTDSRFPLTRGALRAEVERHSDRTMTVVSLSGHVSITRCRVCPKEDTRPCTALRVLALPYAQHPAYRPEWGIAPHDAGMYVVPVQAGAGPES